MADQPQQKFQRSGQEGSRWVNARPTGEEVAKWFRDNVPLHENMDPEDFLTGVTLIPARAKEDEVVGFNQQTGAPILQERVNLYFVPYIKVETRIAYFWKLMGIHPEWLGVIEPAVPGEAGLPPGFFTRTVESADSKKVTFICCSMRVRVFDREKVSKTRVRYEGDERVEITEGETIIDPPAGTKAVNVLGRFGPDENALMKAETGAIGRALGMAGILVAPGSGVATAEDMQDAAAAEARVTTGPESATVEGADTRPPDVIDAELRAEARALVKRLEEDHPAALEEFRRWATSRRFKSLNELVSPALKGVVTKLRDTLAAADARAQQSAPDVPLGGDEPETAEEAVETVAERLNEGEGEGGMETEPAR